jgi:hypothetical protein
MPKKSRAGASYKTQYKAYQAGNKWYKNKERKLESRILKSDEKDIGAIKALEDLKNGKIKYSRNRKAVHKLRDQPLHMIKSERPTLPKLPAQQLYELGLIDEKRYKKYMESSRPRMGGVRKRRAVSK